VTVRQPATRAFEVAIVTRIVLARKYTTGRAAGRDRVYVRPPRRSAAIPPRWESWTLLKHRAGFLRLKSRVKPSTSTVSFQVSIVDNSND